VRTLQIGVNNADLNKWNRSQCLKTWRINYRHVIGSLEIGNTFPALQPKMEFQIE
jgi:hypothetical protein